MDCSVPGLSVPHDLPKFAQIHVHVPLHGSLPYRGEGACIARWSYEPCCAGTPRWTGHSEEFWQNVVNWRNHPSILAARTAWTVWLRDWITTYSLTLLLSHQHCIPRVFLSNLFSFHISFIGVKPASLFESFPTYSHSLPFIFHRYFPKHHTHV